MIHLCREKLVSAAKLSLALPVGGHELHVDQISAVEGNLKIVFRWEDEPDLLGVTIPLPDTTDHPSWAAWEPQTIEEWSMYAVRQTLIEELLTGYLNRATRRTDGVVIWLEPPLRSWVTE